MKPQSIIARGIIWNNASLVFDVPRDNEGGIEKICFEIGPSGHPEATSFPTSDIGMQVFVGTPSRFSVVYEGDDEPHPRPYDVDADSKKYLESMTILAIPFLERCLTENSVGPARSDVEQRLGLLKLQQAERKQKEAVLAARLKATEAKTAEIENESATEADDEEVAEEPAKKPAKKAAKKKAKKKAK